MKIECEEKYKEAMAHAEKTKDATLQNCLERLKSWEEIPRCEVTLYSDFAPLSFYFVLRDEAGNRRMNGGVIYHGNPDESFSVQLIPTVGWSIHT